MVFVIEVNQSHDSPEIVNPVGIIKWHAPAMRLGRETAQKQNPCILRQEWFKRMLFGVHRVGVASFTKVAYICNNELLIL